MLRDWRLPRRRDRHHIVRTARSKGRGRPPNRFGDVGLRQVAIMSLDHSRVGVPKVLRDDQQWGPGHNRQTGPRMP